MKNPNEIEELIFKSIRESDLFGSEWESMFYSNLLKMIITKGGGIEEFITHFGSYFDWMDMEYYFKDDFIQRYGKDGYQLLLDYVGEISDVKY